HEAAASPAADVRPVSCRGATGPSRRSPGGRVRRIRWIRRAAADAAARAAHGLRGTLPDARAGAQRADVARGSAPAMARAARLRPGPLQPAAARATAPRRAGNQPGPRAAALKRLCYPPRFWIASTTIEVPIAIIRMSEATRT